MLARIVENAKPYKKTKKAYKLFELRGGELYPLYVNAKEPTKIGVWIEAKEGVRKDNGKVKSKLGDLAYRPGWHCSEYPIATHIGEKKNPDDKDPSYRRKNQVWAEVEIPADKDYQPEADSMGKSPRDKQLRYIPKGGYYKYKTNPKMWGTWLIAGAIKVKKILTDAEVSRINKPTGRDDLPRRPE